MSGARAAGGRGAAVLSALGVVLVLLGCGNGSPEPDGNGTDRTTLDPAAVDPVGVWTLDPVATLAASQDAVAEHTREFAGEQAVEIALRQYRTVLAGTRATYDLRADGTFVATRNQPNPATGGGFVKDEQGTWERDGAELVLVIEDPTGGPYDEHREARIDAQGRLVVRVPQGPGPLPNVFVRP